jgi:hypothetical protein
MNRDVSRGRTMRTMTKRIIHVPEAWIAAGGLLVLAVSHVL